MIVINASVDLEKLLAKLLLIYNFVIEGVVDFATLESIPLLILELRLTSLLILAFLLIEAAFDIEVVINAVVDV
jgi:hypothetical protein